MVRKIDYMKHVLKTVCRFNDDDGVSPKQITERVQKLLKHADSAQVRSEVRKALIYGMKNNLLKRDKGRYKLKLSTISTNDFSENVFVPLDNGKRPYCATCCRVTERNSDYMMKDKPEKLDQANKTILSENDMPEMLAARQSRGRHSRVSRKPRQHRRRSHRSSRRRRRRDATPPKPDENAQRPKLNRRLKPLDPKNRSQTTVNRPRRSTVSGGMRKDVNEPKKQTTKDTSQTREQSESKSPDAQKENDSPPKN